jgi:hypothetical protein
MVSKRHEKEYISAALIVKKLFRVIWSHGAPKLTIIALIMQLLVLSTHLKLRDVEMDWKPGYSSLIHFLN